MFQKATGSWTVYREWTPYPEIDFHDGPRSYGTTWDDRVASFYDRTMEALEDAYAKQVPYVVFTHGHSTSRPGKTTARSIVRKIMRSPQATPYIERSRCIQHESVFVAAIRRHDQKEPSALESR